MARAGRPASESYQPARSSLSQSLSDSSGAVKVEDEDDHAPIFSLSKSSVDVLMAVGPPHKRDPAWTRLDLRRSSSTNTHSEQNSVTLQPLHTHMWQHVNATSPHQLAPTTQYTDIHNPPALSERWISNMQRWSGCSGSTHSRSSTPDTVVSRPCSLMHEAPCSASPDSPMSKLTSPSTTPSPFISPLGTPTLTSVQTSSPLTPNSQQQEELFEPSPTLSSPKIDTSPSSHSHSPDPLRLTSTEDEGFLENNSLSFQFPSPIPSSVSLDEAGVYSNPEYLVDDVIEPLSSPTEILEGEEARSPVQILSYPTPNSPEQESKTGPSVCFLELPWQPEQSGPAGRGWRSPLVSSLSESQLGDTCRCGSNAREGIAKVTKVEVFRQEASVMSRPEMADAAVQTISPIGSWWDLKMNISTSNMGSHSILGSPPGSRLNLKSSAGSNSNLVSASSSMFPVSSVEEEEKQGDDPVLEVASASSYDLESRRPCLKMQVQEMDDLGGRRSSMKQVQWDEDGMTWDVHGASVDPEELNTAILKHLESQKSPEPPRRSSKKKKAPKPPLISNVAPKIEGTPEADQGRATEQEEGDKKKEIEEASHRGSTAEDDKAKEDEQEICGEESISPSKSPSPGNGHSRKKSVLRSLRRPRWCGASATADD
ncbi:flocculation protein FLO11 [Archocentrus centrarchus]|uniref:flocculation protein FLO11 n=1 Tax=Archocentrus centrarchus TaxID=63155 RepID=UPI0011E9D20B|nr:flocculation protein FLO11-like [Archocentrus centrarchus]